ncbi:MAG: FkbM family methyltransferase [Candidatus Schekmanbacteria bacterium]|nr:FkbM family methyltransferase [Candidatus Schekmanbacteria bacterium]
MIRKLIQKTANKLGYRISRVTLSEKEPLSEIHRLCRDIERPIIFDVGAHHGHLSLSFRSLFPKATIYAFEPFPKSFERLKENTSTDPLIKTFNFGLSDTSGQLTFNSNVASVTNSLLETDTRGEETWGDGVLNTKEKIIAQFTTLDSFVREMSIPRIDILKLDVQGAEYMVLRGGRDFLSRSNVTLVYSEIITQPTYNGQLLFHESLADFYSHGFIVHNIYNISLKTDGRLRQLEVIFVLKDK